MSSIRIGNFLPLNPHDVSDNAIAVLATRLETPPRGFFVTCCVCGKERYYPSLVDPGQIVYERFTCSKVGKRCSVNQTTHVITGFSLVPGSLVFALHDPQYGRFWPGIVEDSPDQFSSYIQTIHNGENGLLTAAYFVTFINGENWLGGWVRADELYPFEKQFHSHVDSYIEGLKFNEAVEQCDASLRLSLRDRLLKHSFVAFAARQRGMWLSNNCIPRELGSAAARTINKERWLPGHRRIEIDEEIMDWENSPPVRHA